VKEYQELKEAIDKLVGHINGKFSTPSWSPIRYIFGSVNQVKTRDAREKKLQKKL
jgi:trehalose 6-phosphate synthase/phosphatase